MRRVLASLLLVGTIALAIPRVMHAQRGGRGGGGGGHAGGFSGGGGMGGRGFGGSFSGPAMRSFPAPRMNFSPGPTGYARPYVAYPQRSWPVARSPFGQLSAPAVRRGPYPGVANTKNGGGQWSHGGYDGHHYRSTYRYGYYYGAPLYTTPWFGSWPYFGNWDDFGDSYAPDTGAALNQYYAPEQETPSGPEEEARPAYPPAIVGSPGVAISEPTVTIIYKDGHAELVRNYVLTPTTLLMADNAAAGLVLAVPLELVNLPATEQANRAAGVEFRVPVRN